MKFDNKDIYEALGVLKAVCETYSDCTCCPLRDKGDRCGIRVETPQNWEIIPPDEYKAFN